MKTLSEVVAYSKSIPTGSAWFARAWKPARIGFSGSGDVEDGRGWWCRTGASHRRCRT